MQCCSHRYGAVMDDFIRNHGTIAGVVGILIAAVPLAAILMFLYWNRPVSVDNPVGTVQVDTLGVALAALPSELSGDNRFVREEEKERIVGQIWRIAGVERLMFYERTGAWEYRPAPALMVVSSATAHAPRRRGSMAARLNGSEYICTRTPGYRVNLSVRPKVQVV